MSLEPILSVRGLTVAFPGSEPVRDFGFDVAQRETVAIVGESGSGKSLTALSLMRLLPTGARIAAGTAAFGGRDLFALSETQVRRLRGSEIAMIFQEPMTSLNPVMTIGRQIGEVLRQHKGLSARAARAEAIELLNLVRIPSPQQRVDEHPHQLSGGMRQRVMIAIAVACRPRLLIADEPTTALDVTIQAQILELLDTLRSELSMGLVLITHDLGVVSQWADRVVVMYAGRQVEEAAPRGLFEYAYHPYTRGLLAASPMQGGYSHRDGPLKEIPGTIASAAAELGCPFAPRCELAGPDCRKTMPPLFTPEPSRRVACPRHLVGERHAVAVGF